MNSKRIFKVCYVLKRYPRFSETFIVNEILGLEARGIEVCIVALKPPVEGVFHESLSRVKAKVIYLPALSQNPAKFYDSLCGAIQDYGLPVVGELLDQNVADLEHGVRAARIAADFDADVIHAHFATSAAAIARIAARLSNRPYTVTAHAKDIFHQDVDERALSARLSDAARVITVSEYNVRYLSQQFPACKARIRRVYNGMPLQRLPVRGARASRARIVSVGRLIEKKGMEFLLQAIALLRDEFPDIHCDVIGDGPLREPLTDLARQLGVADQVTFHGILAQHSVHKYVCEADVFVAPCVVSDDGDRDGLPTVLLEAMAIGTPCISTPVTGIPEIIVDQKTGLLVPERSPQAIAEACSKLFRDMGLSLAVSAAAADLIRSQFDIQITTGSLAEEWRTIAGEPREQVA